MRIKFKKLLPLTVLLGIALTTVAYNNVNKTKETKLISYESYAKVKAPKEAINSVVKTKFIPRNHPVSNNKKIIANNNDELLKKLSNNIESHQEIVHIIYPGKRGEQLLDLVVEMTGFDTSGNLITDYAMYSNGDIKFTYLNKNVDIETNKKIDEWCSKNLYEEMTDYEKVRKIHDYLIDTNYYTMGNNVGEVESYNKEGYSVYDASALILGNGGVCDGYSRAFQKMCNSAGVKSLRLTGYATNNGIKQYHAWNAVKLANKWYYLDITWDDPTDGSEVKKSGFENHNYFLKSESDFSKTHKPDMKFITGSESDYIN